MRIFREVAEEEMNIIMLDDGHLTFMDATPIHPNSSVLIFPNHHYCSL